MNDTLKRPLYADTLESISVKGADWFFKSNFTKEMVQELKDDYNSILTEEDFNAYSVVTREVTESKYNNFAIRSISAPSSGPVLSLILNILDGKRRSCIREENDTSLVLSRL